MSDRLFGFITAVILSLRMNKTALKQMESLPLDADASSGGCADAGPVTKGAPHHD